MIRNPNIRLLTLTGPGGVGKSRLALEVIARLQDDFPDGIRFLALATVRNPDLVPKAIAEAFRVPDTRPISTIEDLISILRQKELLLLLDNFEQVSTAAPFLVELLGNCPQLKILVTSRSLLHVSGEHHFPIPPLATPDPASISTDEPVHTYAAVQLFIERARAAQPDFTIHGNDGATIAAICQRLDGLPLAIEMAATRMRVFPPALLLDRLQQRLPLLAGGAQDQPSRLRTMRGAIAWSYDLLTEQEQTLFRRLAVFSGGFTIEAADAVCDLDLKLEHGTVLGISSLLDKSLLQRVDGHDSLPRFTMLETIREYSSEQLHASGEEQSMRQRHVEYFVTLAENAEGMLHGQNQAAWLVQLEAERGNFRTALEWGLTETRTARSALSLCAALQWFWYLRGYFTEGRTWTESALKRTPGEDRTWLRAKGLAGAGMLAIPQGDYTVARSQLEESIAIGKEIGDALIVANGLHFLGVTALTEGYYVSAHALLSESVDHYRRLQDTWGTATSICSLGIAAVQLGDQAAAALFEEGLLLSREMDDTWGLARALHYSGEIARVQHEYVRARHLYEESLLLYRDLGHRNTAASVLHNLGYVTLHQGDLQQAMTCFIEGLALHAEHGDTRNIAHCLAGIAGVLGHQRQSEQAVLLFGATEAVFQNIGAAMWPVDRIEYERNLTQARRDLPDASCEAAWRRGRLMSLDQAIVVANDAATKVIDEPALQEHYPPKADHGLTLRELEVLKLLIEGHSDRKIGEILFISPKTVGNHVTSILSKLEVTTRTAAATYAVRQQLV